MKIRCLFISSLCLVFIATSGCVYGVKITKVPSVINTDSIFTKMSNSNDSKTAQERNKIGVFFEVLQYIYDIDPSMSKEEVYRAVRVIEAMNIIGALNKEGINIVFLRDENDPSLNEVRILVYIGFREARNYEIYPKSSFESTINPAPKYYSFVVKDYSYKIYDVMTGYRIESRTDSLSNLINAKFKEQGKYYAHINTIEKMVKSVKLVIENSRK